MSWPTDWQMADDARGLREGLDDCPVQVSIDKLVLQRSMSGDIDL